MECPKFDIDGRIVKAGDIIIHNYGIPPTTVELFVFGDDRAEYLLCVDATGNISALTDGIIESSHLKEAE